jgi:Aerobic-type carbon monoxide dehydrogenase, large subunit CoxL/CutL homologs
MVSEEEIVVGQLARLLERPVRWVESRTENLTGYVHGRAQAQTVTIGGTRDGRVTHYRLEVVQDSGAYPKWGAFLLEFTRNLATGVYDIANVEFSGVSVATNTAPTCAYRGAGRPEATAAIERAMDLFAMEIGMDPAEVRRRNFVTPEAFPYTTPTGTSMDSGDYVGSLDRALSAAKYENLRVEQQRRRDSGDRMQMGIGVATYVEITGFGGSEYGEVRLRPDGSVLASTGATPIGTGHHTHMGDAGGRSIRCSLRCY